MLQLLHIENIAVIERADIAFDCGFNVLTGETGAGKSIVIDALSAVLGQRTPRDLIRTGADKAFVSAIFVHPEIDAEELGVALEDDGTLLLQREIYADGRNVCRAGGRPITVSQLRVLGSHLVNIYGQRDGQELLDEQQHLAYLDTFARVDDPKAAYRTCYDAMSETKKKMDALQMDEAEKERRVDMLRHQIEELSRAELKEGEEETLNTRRNILRNGEKFIGAVSEAGACLDGGESADGAVSLLRTAAEALHSLRGLDEEFVSLSDRLASLQSEAYDIACTLRDKRESFDFSPQELDELESRCDLLYRLKKKYGATVEECIAYLARSQAELDEISCADDALVRLQTQFDRQKAEAYAAAEALSQARRRKAEILQNAIAEELRDLDMPKVRFAVEFTEKPLDADGMDGVRFLMSANTGEALKPIDRVASGGELARIMLALKNVLAGQDAIGTMVFDEVDTGVSGRAAQRVAEKLGRVARYKQVLCVTHLAQLAAMADTHMSVEKGEANGRTCTQVQTLDHPGRCDEIARLTGGDLMSQAIRESAEELLQAAENYKKALT